MCRHLAYLGPPATLRSLLIDPPHGLYRQAWAPRRQRHGTVNADGFGIGWYADGDPVPARYRRGMPIWGDPSLPDLARVTRSGAVLAAVRNATPGMARGRAGGGAVRVGPWLFSHNGVLDGLARVGRRAAPRPPGRLLSLEAMVDSAFLWALVLEWLQAGAAMDAALAATIAAVEAGGGTGRFNFLLTDGRRSRRPPGGTRSGTAGRATSVVVASEPGDDEPGWTEVPDRHSLRRRRRRSACGRWQPRVPRSSLRLLMLTDRHRAQPLPTAPTTTSATKGS